jgi:hypothetical protein
MHQQIIEGIVVAIKSRQVSEWYPEQDRVVSPAILVEKTSFSTIP